MAKNSDTITPRGKCIGMKMPDFLREVGPIAQSVEQRTFNLIGFISPHRYYAP